MSSPEIEQQQQESGAPSSTTPLIVEGSLNNDDRSASIVVDPPVVENDALSLVMEIDTQQVTRTESLRRQAEAVPKDKLLKEETSFKELTTFDKIKIYFYNTIEPLLVGTILASTISIAQLGSIVYFLVTMGCLMPMLLTENLTRIKVKKYTTLGMVCAAPVFTSMKMWIYCQFTDTKNIEMNPDTPDTLRAFLGIWPDQWTKTFLNDIVIFVLAGLLFWHYCSQVDQASRKLQRQGKGTLKFQTAIKLLHFEFGLFKQYLFMASYVLLFCDTLFYQTIVQFATLVILFGYIHLWSTAADVTQSTKEKMLRVIQITSYVFIIVAFILRVPGVYMSEEAWATNLFQWFGLEALVSSKAFDYQWLSRGHRFILSYAVTLAEAFFVSNQMSKPADKPTNREATNSVAEVRLAQSPPPVPKMNRRSQSSLGPAITEPLLDEDLQDRPRPRPSITVAANNIQLSEIQPAYEKKKTAEKKKKEFKWAKLWSYLELPLLLWVCRAFCFVQAYRYHDWQALIPLVWILHSTMFPNRQRFVMLTTYVYLPLFMLCYCFYFAVNIFGLIVYSSWDQTKTNKMRLYGFYDFTNPEYDFLILMLVIYSLALYTRKNKNYFDRQSQRQNKKQKSLMEYLRNYTPTLHSFGFIVLVNTTTLISIYLVIFSLLVMDIFHIFVLLVMVVSMFYPKFYHKNIVWLLVYANFFILSKYIYTLVCQEPQAKVSNIVIGFWSASYQPDITRPYFRYEPPTAAWFFVIAVMMQYRLNQLLGLDEEALQKEMKKSDEKIAKEHSYLWKSVQWIKLIMNHSLGMITFVVLFTVIYMIRRTFMNGISLVLIMTLFGVYLMYGVESLVKYWRVFEVYQAIVLVLLLTAQFFLQVVSQENQQQQDPPFIENWKALSAYYRALVQYTGFYLFTDPIWRQFLPYVFMFFFAHIVAPRLKTKAQMETRSLKEEEAHSDSQVDGNFDELELTAYKVAQRHFYMQYQTSYLLWKMKWAWPFLDTISLFFNYFMSIFVLVCALYYSLAVIWLVWLTIFMLQTWSVQRVHRKYQKKEIERFMTKEIPYELGSRDEISAEESRLIKLKSKFEGNNTFDPKTKKDLERQIQFAEQQKPTPPRIKITDEEAVAEHKRYKAEVAHTTLEGREMYWSSQYFMLVIANILIYLSVFIIAQANPNNKETLVPIQYRKQVLFLFFFGGFYLDQDMVTLEDKHSTNLFWPFLVLLILLVIEKGCQMWLKDRCNCTEEAIAEFKQLETEFDSTKEKLAKKKDQSSQDVSKQSDAGDKEVIVETPEESGFTNDMLVIPDQRRKTFNPLSLSESSKKNLEAIKHELSELLEIKYKLKMELAIKILIQETAIALVFVSLIYKQSVLSFILYVVLVYYTIQKFRRSNPMLLVRYIIILVILIQYVLALTNLSSYNSPKQFPSQLLEQKVSSDPLLVPVYPSENKYYYSIPWYFEVTQKTFDKDGTLLPLIDVSFYEFFGISVAGRTLNGIWIDFIVLMLIQIQLNFFSIWIIKKEFKIVRSDKCEDLLKQYYETKEGKKLTDDELDDKFAKEYAKELGQEKFLIRAFKYLSEMLYTNFALLMITFLLLTSIFSHNFVALVYFIFSMILIYNYRNFYIDSKARDNQIVILKYFLLPYLLLDIFFQLVTQIPMPNTEKYNNWVKLIGFVKVWTYTPSQIYLGEPVFIEVDVGTSTSLVILFLKAVVYFVISVQIDTVISQQFMKFYDSVLFENLAHVKVIGLGLAYRANNFKNKKLKKQADNYTQLHSMLTHVRQLLKTRDILQNKGKEVLDKTIAQKKAAALDASSSPLKDAPEVSPQKEIQIANLDESAFIEVEADEKVWLNYRSQFKIDVKRDYEERYKKLPVMFKVYLWLRRNFVQDLLFKHSFEHLQDMVKQYREGRTSVRTQVELGLSIETKQDWLREKQMEFDELKEQGKCSQEEYDGFDEFRRAEIEKFALKPWQRYDPKTYKTYKKLFNYFFVIQFKIMSSNLQVFCYLFMILAVIMNGGLIYMVYPALVFGIAMCEEEKPGKKFWYFVIFYTQTLILLQYLAQLSVWQTNDNDLEIGTGILKWCTDHNIGIVKIDDVSSHYGQLFWLIFPELAILVSVLVHIQCETMAGIFNFSLYDFETFKDGLKREEENMLNKDKKFAENFVAQSIQARQLLSDGLDYDQKRAEKKWQSELDKKERELMPEPQQPANLLDQTFDQTQDYIRPTIVMNLSEEISKFPLVIDYSKLRQRSHSLDMTFSADFAKMSLLQQALEKVKKGTTFCWDNAFFDRLYPRIKQQKPGLDLYVWTALTQIILIIYVIFSYSQMSAKNESTLSQQFSSNQLTGAMVVTMLVLICIMVIDRYFYSSQQFFSRKSVAKNLNTDEALVTGGQSSHGKTSDNQSQQEIDIKSDSQNSAQQQLLNPQSLKDPSSTNSLAISSQQETQEEDTDQHQKPTFQDWLVPQYIHKSPSRVTRYYFFWFVLILIHWFIFFWLTNEKSVCAAQPYCNPFNKNWYLIWFYIIFCIYFSLCAKQIMYGLPELKKGGFMLGHYDPLSKYTYQGWYYTPFLFELRTIVDWTFTTTALDVFQSISLAQIQSDMFIAKCYNRPYMAKELGKKISWIEKVGVGLSLTVFILFLIAGPMLLFSSINPVGQANPVSSGELEVYIRLDDREEGTRLTVPLFYTTQLSKNTTLTQQQYNNLNFNNPVSTSEQFMSSQTQALQFSPISDSVWGITQPKKQLLLKALQKIKYDRNSTQYTALAYLEARFNRDSATSATAIYQTVFPLNYQTQDSLDTLIQQIACNQTAVTNATGTVSPETIPIAVSLNQNSQVFTLSQAEPLLAGFSLRFKCDPLFSAEDYWYVEQTINRTVSPDIYPQEIAIFNGTNGFGYFTFNQDVLPNFLSSYASSVIFFYVAIVQVIASAFRSAFVPLTWEVFIINAPQTEEILMICQCIYIFRVQRNLKNEEELYHILLEIMRSPETIKSLCKTSLKKKL